MAADISTEIAGVRLKSPVIVSAGPLTRDVPSIQKLARHGGVGAVVIKTIYSKAADTPRPYMAKIPGGLLNYDWSASGIDDWSHEQFAELAALGLPMIASVLDKDDDTLISMARAVEERGAAMIELPAGGLPTAERVRERVGKLRRNLRVPLAVKIGFTVPDLRAWVEAIEGAGADAITAINTIGPGLALDTETGRPLMGNVRGYGYVSGQALHALSLRVVADVVSLTRLPVMGVGGVQDADGAIQMFMAGASAVQVHTAGILKGLSVFPKLANGIAHYLEVHGHGSLADIMGMSQQYLSLERHWDRLVPEVQDEDCTGCSLCARACVHDAITMVDRLPQFDGALCHGCGLCISVCAPHALSLVGT